MSQPPPPLAAAPSSAPGPTGAQQPAFSPSPAPGAPSAAPPPVVMEPMAQPGQASLFSSRAALGVLGLGALLALVGTAALVAAIFLH